MLSRKHEERKLRKHACFSVSFTADVAGTAGDKVYAKVHGKKVLVLKGTKSVSSAGTVKIKDCLTKAGKKLVKKHKKFKLMIKATDSPTGGKPVTVTGTVTLKP